LLLDEVGQHYLLLESLLVVLVSLRNHELVLAVEVWAAGLHHPLVLRTVLVIARLARVVAVATLLSLTFTCRQSVKVRYVRSMARVLQASGCDTYLESMAM